MCLDILNGKFAGKFGKDSAINTQSSNFNSNSKKIIGNRKFYLCGKFYFIWEV